MSAPVRVWLEIAPLPAFRVGGWAYVVQSAEGLGGWAGGGRQMSPERAALSALAAALQAAGDKAEVVVRSTSAVVSSVPQRIAEAHAGEPPAEDLDLWAQLSTRLGKTKVTIARVALDPASPNAFATAWAELARDKAKGGAFSSAIPKTNLAKVRGLP